jgi:hypothetical protein
MIITDALYKDVSAVRVETEKLTALFLPELGGKLTSLKCTSSEREFLEQDKGKTYKKLSYAGDYTAAECSAFDDMFPTIDRCYYDRFPWQGVELPDHGEVCGLEWKYRVENGVLGLWTYSPRFGYRFEKTVSEENGGIRIDYKVTNNTQFEFDCLYAAHCMIAAEEEGRILLPGVEDGEKGMLVFSSAPQRGSYGSPVVWRSAGPGMGISPGGKQKPETYKFFFDRSVTRGECAYRYSDGTIIRMTYSAGKLPWLCLWLNWGGFHGMFSAAFEICSGTFDRPDIARLHGQNGVLPPYGEFGWSICFNSEKE